MCKLVLMPHIPAGKSKNAWRLARAVTPAMTRGDRDGFGYAAVTTHMSSEGSEQMLAEKWADPKDAWNTQLPEVFQGLEAALQGGMDDSSYRRYGFDLDEGAKRPPIKALMLHSRFSTCGGAVENAHPFILEDKDGPWAALVHNGVVSTQGLRLEQSTCDSEGILNRLRDEHVFYVPENLQNALDAIKGYYAFGVLCVTYEDGWVMDVVKDSTAQLSAVYVHEIGEVIYATSPEHIEGACKKLKWKRPRVAKMRDNTRIRYSVNTGKVLIVDHFKPAEYSRPQWATQHASGDYSGFSSRGWKDEDDDMEQAWATMRARNSSHAVSNDDPLDEAEAAKVAKSKIGTYIGEASEVQAALQRMETRERTGDDLDSEALVIDPSTGTIEMPDGTIVQLADESNHGQEEIKV